MPCSNSFDQHLKDAAKHNEDLLKRSLPEEDPQADKELWDKMKQKLQELRDKQA